IKNGRSETRYNSSSSNRKRSTRKRTKKDSEKQGKYSARQKACAKPHSNVESLKRALKKAWNEITLDTLVKIVDNFPKRLKACVDAKGGHFE
uniref:Uncharacterized protein n=1 Tax=Acrobeloides nanus TaxID=290746 RepID=A0A914ENR7_9BILA